MSLAARRIWRGLTRNVAATAPGDHDPRLVGRTYAIPFDHVWRAAMVLANGGLRRWRILDADDQNGILRAAARTPLLHRVDDVLIRIVLDEDAQTRVDARSVSRSRYPDFGANGRRLARFFRTLDRSLARSHGPRPDSHTAAVRP